jgi:hypothetical protein
VQPTTAVFHRPYGASISAEFTPLLKDGKPVMCFPSQKDKTPTGQYFSVRYTFNGRQEDRIVMRALVASVADARAPAVGADQRPMSFYQELWTDGAGNVRFKRIEGNPENQTIKYTLDSGEDSFSRKGWHPTTAEELFASRVQAESNRAALAQKKADSSVSVKNVAEMFATMFRDVFKGNAEAMQAAVASAVNGGGGKQKKEG